MKKIKGLWAEFKKFICRGNIVDLSVAVIIGAAFNAIVTSLTNNIIKPIINWAVGGSDGAGLVTMLRAVYTTDADGNSIIDMTNSIYIDWGTFIMKIIDFLMIALVLFVIVKVYSGIKNAAEKANERRIKQTEKLIKKFRKGGASEEQAMKLVEEQVAEAEAVAEPPKPTAEELLTEIRDLLKDSRSAEGKDRSDT